MTRKLEDLTHQRKHSSLLDFLDGTLSLPSSALTGEFSITAAAAVEFNPVDNGRGAVVVAACVVDGASAG